MKLGSGNQGQLTFIDIIGIMGYLVGLENLDMNLTQDDKQQLQQDLANKADLLLKQIHSHLEQQDNKIDLILDKIEKLGELK